MTTACILRLHLASLLMVALPTPGASQRIERLPVRWGPDLPAETSPPHAIPASTLQSIRDSTVYQASYWQEGLVAGGMTGAILGGLAGAAVCGMSESSDSNCGLKVLLGAFIAATPGAGLGALIGGLFPKEESGSEQAS